jgi:hypothetical protein
MRSEALRARYRESACAGALNFKLRTQILDLRCRYRLLTSGPPTGPGSNDRGIVLGASDNLKRQPACTNCGIYRFSRRSSRFPGSVGPERSSTSVPNPFGNILAPRIRQKRAHRVSASRSGIQVSGRVRCPRHTSDAGGSVMASRISVLLFAFLLTAGIASAQVVIRIGPPPPVHVGVVGVAPGPGFVWVEGFHRWDGGRYVWVPGEWRMPPRPRARWVPPHYRRFRGGWAFVPGHWR